MSRELDLTRGSIVVTLTKLALPIMGTAFIQTAYSLTDVMWLGRLSTDAVAAAAVGGFFLWLGAALVMITVVGAGVNVAQSYGKRDLIEAQSYLSSGILINLVISLSYAFLLFIFAKQIVGFFNFEDEYVISMAITYLRLLTFGIIFHFMNPLLATSLNSAGNSVTPFKINTIGLALNMALDPFLIFGLEFGIKGAALATVISQIIVTLLFVYIGSKERFLYMRVKLFVKPKMDYIKAIVTLGFPPFLQMGAHAVIAMIVTRIVVRFGSMPVAVQTVGAQIESISWMTGEGFAQAITAFVAQNFGAQNYNRIKEGYYKGISVLAIFGAIVTACFLLFGEEIFSIFTPDDANAIKEGGRYLRILGLSQLFMLVEIGSVGAFNGIGRTMPPTLVNTSLNIMRIPAALFLSSSALGLAGIWWATSLSTILKGAILFIWFSAVLKRLNASKIS